MRTNLWSRLKQEVKLLKKLICRMHYAVHVFNGFKLRYVAEGFIKLLVSGCA